MLKNRLGTFLKYDTIICGTIQILNLLFLIMTLTFTYPKDIYQKHIFNWTVMDVKHIEFVVITTIIAVLNMVVAVPISVCLKKKTYVLAEIFILIISIAIFGDYFLFIATL